MGNLYVLSKEQLKASGHELVSLVDDLKTDCTTRFQIQEAWLAGLYLNQVRIKPAAITAQITAPGSIFKAFAEAAGIQINRRPVSAASQRQDFGKFAQPCRELRSRSRTRRFQRRTLAARAGGNILRKHWN